MYMYVCIYIYTHTHTHTHRYIYVYMTWRSGEPWDMKYSRISGNITTCICHSANRLCVCVHVSIRQHTSAYVSIRHNTTCICHSANRLCVCVNETGALFFKKVESTRRACLWMHTAPVILDLMTYTCEFHYQSLVC